MSSYARLAKLPPPKLGAIEVNSLLLRASSLETRQRVFFEEGPPLTFQGDIDQLEQALINLIQNGVDSAEASGGRVFLHYRQLPTALEITVRDEGTGLPNTANLFVPFFTTKRGGSGIGLVLSRQIAEAHGGSLSLRNAQEGPGCEAVVTLPLH